jgi:hypothetical protein
MVFPVGFKSRRRPGSGPDRTPDCVEAATSRYELGPLICEATALNVDAALVPIVRTAPKQMTMIKDNMTAYSTAVGPSSDFRKRLILLAKFFTMDVTPYRPASTHEPKLKNPRQA